ncbi:hypothetical protein PHMEG_00015927 [Phytophthora megakarya]|uniref:HTH CENPB-type domain-containing protein n=1 Tax=Phytophthora megakarya TaxID=4795 RepID=A0A225W082_9STRA|nr:hypothetical protein PHMEG_00015927 [Phytophthora megakarya]
MGRPRTTGDGKKPKRYCRIAVDYTHKRLVLDYLAANHTVTEAIDHFYPFCTAPEKTRKQKQISKWKKQVAHINSLCSDGKGHLKNLRSSGQATTLSRDAENDIVLWLSSMRREGCPVTSQMLHYKALEVAADEDLSPDIFKASTSWRRRFMRRHKFSIRARTCQSQTTPDDAAEAEAKDKMLLAVLFEYLPRKTITKRGEKPCSGKDKARATVMLLGDWHGNKYAPFLVFKSGSSRRGQVQVTNDTLRHGFGVHLRKDMFALQALHNCRIYGNPTAWWNSRISLVSLHLRMSTSGRRVKPAI